MGKKIAFAFGCDSSTSIRLHNFSACEYDKKEDGNYIKLRDGKKKIDVLLIKNPCQKKDFPEEVNRNYFCKSNDLNKDEVFIVDNQLVVGLLHSANKCKAKDLSTISNNEMTGKFCAFKNQIPVDKLNMGMGDIFIKMAR